MIDKKSETIKNMFDKISKNYDFTNNIISFFTHKKIKREAILNLNIKPYSKVLDLCTGTGDFAGIIKKINPNANVIGVDFSQNMINIAKSKHKNIEFYTQDAMNLNFEDNFFDYVVMGFGLRNTENYSKVLSEIYRILKKDGEFLHLDFNNGGIINKIYDSMVLLFSNFLKEKSAYKYLINSKKFFYSGLKLLNLFKSCGFKTVLKKSAAFNVISYQILKK